MKRNAKRVVLAALLPIAMATSIICVASNGASAITTKPCDANAPSEFTRIETHYTELGVTYQNLDSCYANGGEMMFPDEGYGGVYWVTKIWTGNNRVQWHGDGRWQPDGGIPPNTTMTWSNHPGGVEIDGLKIM